MKKQTFLVTGGAGFIGSHLVERLANEGHKVICMDNYFRGSKKNLSESKNIILKKGDVRKLSEWPKYNDKINGIFHLAAINGTPNFYEIPEVVLDVNVKGTINALEYSIKNKIKYFAFASSSETYGIPKKFPTPENIPLVIQDVSNPRWSYGGSKIIGEIYCANFARKYGFRCSILRYNNIYGPRDEKGHVIPDLIKKMKSKKKFSVEGNGKETRSFCYIDDAIDATIMIKNKQKEEFNTFNIGTNIETKISDLVKLLIQISGKKREPFFKEKANAGTSRRLPDISKIRKMGFDPKTSLEEGLKIVHSWYSKS
ncbi:MAG: NAD-dependent epimerase/dehydratase family protein [Candidatus Nitrosopumilus sp. bin_6a]